jgi:hypothetical protein
MNAQALLNILGSTQGGGAIRNLGSQVGLSEETTQSAVQALLPTLLAGVRRENDAGGLNTLLQALPVRTAERVLDDGTVLGEAATTDQGNALLGTLFGSKDVSRQVATSVSADTGVEESALKRLLPLLATMVVGRVANEALEPAETPSATSGLGTMLGALGQNRRPTGGALGALSGLLDSDGDGEITDDLLSLINRRGQ